MYDDKRIEEAWKDAAEDTIGKINDMIDQVELVTGTLPNTIRISGTHEYIEEVITAFTGELKLEIYPVDERRFLIEPEPLPIETHDNGGRFKRKRGKGNKYRKH